MKFVGGLFVCASAFCWVRKSPEPSSLAVANYFDCPSPGGRVPTDALVSRCVIRPGGCVVRVVGPSCRAQVESPAIKAIGVLVVYLWRIRHSPVAPKEPVQGYVAGSGIHAASLRVGHKGPPPCSDDGADIFVNDRELALGQRDQHGSREFRIHHEGTRKPWQSERQEQWLQSHRPTPAPLMVVPFAEATLPGLVVDREVAPIEGTRLHGAQG